MDVVSMVVSIEEFLRVYHGTSIGEHVRGLFAKANTTEAITEIYISIRNMDFIQDN